MFSGLRSSSTVYGQEVLGLSFFAFFYSPCPVYIIQLSDVIHIHFDARLAISVRNLLQSVTAPRADHNQSAAWLSVVSFWSVERCHHRSTSRGHGCKASIQGPTMVFFSYDCTMCPMRRRRFFTEYISWLLPMADLWFQHKGNKDKGSKAGYWTRSNSQMGVLGALYLW